MENNTIINKKSMVFIFGLVYPYSNGVGNCTMLRAKLFLDKGYDVSIITNRIKKTDLLFEEYEGIKIHRILNFKQKKNGFMKNIYFLYSGLKCFKKIKEINPDIIYGMMLDYGFFSAIFSKFFKKTSITEAHGSDVTEIKGCFRQFITYLSLKYNDIVITTNNEFKNILQKRIPHKKIYLLYNFLDSDKINKNRKTIVLDKTKFHIMTVGRMVEIKGKETKGISYILKAMNNLDNCILHVFGDGPLFEVFNKYIVEKKLSNKIILYKEVTHNIILDYLNSVDVFVLASLPGSGEGLNMTAIESSSLKTPVISTPIAGQKEYLIDGENGFFIEAMDSASIIRQIKKIQPNKMLQDKLSKNIYKTYLDKFTPEVWYNNFNKILMDHYGK